LVVREEKELKVVGYQTDQRLSEVVEQLAVAEG
jgi:hypothetical protein